MPGITTMSEQYNPLVKHTTAECNQLKFKLAIRTAYSPNLQLIQFLELGRWKVEVHCGSPLLRQLELNLLLCPSNHHRPQYQVEFIQVDCIIKLSKVSVGSRRSIHPRGVHTVSEHTSLKPSPGVKKYCASPSCIGVKVNKHVWC